MSVVKVYRSVDDELKRLMNNVKLVEPEPDSDGGNDNNSSANASHVPLFVTVWPPKEESLSGTGLALNEYFLQH